MRFRVNLESPGRNDTTCMHRIIRTFRTFANLQINYSHLFLNQSHFDKLTLNCTGFRNELAAEPTT